MGTVKAILVKYQQTCIRCIFRSKPRHFANEHFAFAKVFTPRKGFFLACFHLFPIFKK